MSTIVKTSGRHSVQLNGIFILAEITGEIEERIRRINQQYDPAWRDTGRPTSRSQAPRERARFRHS